MSNLSRRELFGLLGGLAVVATGRFASADSGDITLSKKHYLEISPPQPQMRGDDKIEVIEFFWYGCPHCYQFHPVIEKWKKSIADDVRFIPVPASLNPGWQNHARAYFAAEQLGVLDKIHDPLFKEIHENKRRLVKRGDLADFAAKQGIDKKKFLSTMKSFGVENALLQSQQMSRAMKITGVPAVVVGGKYLTSGAMAGSYPRVIKVINQLVEKVRQERTA